jgi:hypothetical protein
MPSRPYPNPSKAAKIPNGIAQYARTRAMAGHGSRGAGHLRGDAHEGGQFPDAVGNGQHLDNGGPTPLVQTTSGRQGSNKVLDPTTQG